MHLVRNAVVAGAIVFFLPIPGLSTQATSVALDIKKSLAEMTERAASLRNHGADFATPGVYIRSEPRTAAPVRTVGNPGDRISVRRKTPGEPVACPGGTLEREWLEITDQRTHVSGYVSACFVRP